VFEIGNSLREARLRQGLDFPEAEQAIKIRAKYLRALEEEQFDTLPAQTYVKGFLRAYAEYLGLDGQLYVDEYNSRYVLDPSEEFFRPRRSPARAHQQRRIESRVLVFALVGIAALTALVFAAWRYGGGQPSTVLPKTPTRPAPTKQVRVAVSAVHGASMVEVHRTSSLGVPLFAGTLQHGEPAQVFTGKRLWLRLRVPSALRVTVNGVGVPLPAHGPVVAIATRSGLSLIP
jgi:cytoskeletal protein RodZ